VVVPTDVARSDIRRGFENFENVLWVAKLPFEPSFNGTSRGRYAPEEAITDDIFEGESGFRCRDNPLKLNPGQANPICQKVRLG
jgi:hypothetical protein